MVEGNYQQPWDFRMVFLYEKKGSGMWESPKNPTKKKGPGEDRTRDHQIIGYLLAHCNLMLYH